MTRSVLRRHPAGGRLAACLVFVALVLGGCADDDDASLAPRPALGGLVELEVPASWEIAQDSPGLHVSRPDDGPPVLTVTLLPSDGLEDDLTAALRAAAGDGISSSPTTIPGADEASRFERETPGGLWQRGLIARQRDSGAVLLIVLAADVDDGADEELADAILGSVVVTGEPAPGA